MRRTFAIGVWLLAACGAPGDTSLTSDEVSTAEPAPSVEDLFAADRAFNDDVAANGATAWASWFAEDGAQLIPGQMVRGRASILELMGAIFADPTVSLTWDPDYGELSASGDLGFTTGRYVQRRTIGETESVGEGRYITIWRLTAEGEWRVALDGGVADGG
jgi:ketosteroid isomerase-like protein